MSVRQIFRNAFPSIIIIIITVLSSICLFLLINFEYNNMVEKNYKKKYKHKNEISFRIISNSFEDVEKYVDKTKKINFIVESVPVYFNSLENTIMSNVIINSYDLKLPLNNTNANSEDIEKSVLIGKNLIEAVYLKNNKQFIKINGDEYEVDGIIGEDCSSYFDNQVYLFLNESLTEYLGNIALNYGGFFASFQSDEEDVELLLKETIEKNHTVSRLENDFVESKPLFYENKLSIIILFFSLVNYFFVIKFWINERKKEIAIKNIFGWNKVRIIISFWRELLVLIAIGNVISVFLLRVIDKIIGLSLKDYFIQISFKGLLIYSLIIYICLSFIAFLMLFFTFKFGKKYDWVLKE